MQLLVVTLDDSEEFLKTLSRLKEDGLNGIVIPTTSLKHALVTQDYECNHTLLMLVDEEKLEDAKRIVRGITKGLRKKGIMFALPVSFWEGLDN